MKWIGFCKAVIPSVMDESKTLSSRIIVPQPQEQHWKNDGSRTFEWKQTMFNDLLCDPLETIARCSPYGNTGDILGVKEGYKIADTTPFKRIQGVYLADGAPFNIALTAHEWGLWTARKFPYRATPGRFMYASLCRTLIINKGVRVERLQDISGKDAVLEGWPGGHYARRTVIEVSPPTASGIAAREWFIGLWDSINKARGHGWDANDWVWRVSFALHKQP